MKHYILLVRRQNLGTKVDESTLNKSIYFGMSKIGLMILFIPMEFWNVHVHRSNLHTTIQGERESKGMNII